MTGSKTTNGRGASAASRSATIPTISALASMPILTAATEKSANTASICAATISGGTTWITRTPSVFCAVNAVNALAP